jgi:eukaryotic-like serine/threonine-protein kinase
VSDEYHPRRDQQCANHRHRELEVPIVTVVVGTRLGAYEILAPIGAGGMGEVYRARDTKLHRDVALKILPDAVACDPDRLARFTREAQTLAALNHPNIAHIYGLDRQEGRDRPDGRALSFIIMELVEGEDLSQRIARGAIPLDEASPIAKQIAEALEMAHEQGIIHRDLKPANIKLRSDGTVKVLDFGLAKAMEPVGGASNVTQSPTMTTPAMMTGVGMILGTAAYMAPEQARGKAVNKRADIWAFGCVLFEMLTGKPAFSGDTVTDVLAAVVKEAPRWTALPPTVPAAIRGLLRRCLEKDPRRRLQAIGDARVEIEDALQGGPADEPQRAGSARKRKIPQAWIVPTAIVVFAGATIAMLWPKPVDAPAYRTAILPPPGVTLRDNGNNLPSRRLAISPDGRQLAFTGTERDGSIRLWIRTLDGTTARAIEGSDGATFPFWSPDSRSIAFFAQGQGNARLKKVALSGGSPTTLCELPGPNGSGGTWNRDNVILYGAITRGPLRRVAAAGGECAEVTRLNAESGETSHIYPFFLPDGRHFLYLATTQSNGGLSAGGIFVASLDSPERTLLVRDGVNPKYANGHLVYLRNSTLLAQPFDTKRLTVTGEAVPLANDLQVGGQQGFTVGAVSVSETGALAYLTGSAAPSELLWVDRAGKRLGPLGEPGDYDDVALAPDDARASVSLTDSVQLARDIWIYDIARGVRRRFTDDPAADQSAIWSPDGSRLMFRSARKTLGDLYEKLSRGAAIEERWFADAADKYPLSWSQDGRILYQTIGESTGSDMWIVSTHGDRRPVPFRRTRFNETQGQFSPDGNWVAYVSDESGRQEIYVTPSDGTGAPVVVSQGAGPRWRRNGGELFFWVGNRLTAAVVSPRAGAFAVGAVTQLFEHQRRESVGAWYDVSADGQHFLVNTPVEESTPITLLVNWPALLNKRE